MSEKLHTQVSEVAESYGISQNQFIVKAVEQAVWAVQSLEQVGHVKTSVRGSSTAEHGAHNSGDAGSNPAPATPPDTPETVAEKAKQARGVMDMFTENQMTREAEASVALDKGSVRTVSFEDLELQEDAEALAATNAALAEPGDPVPAEDVWGTRHVHKCDQLVEGSVHYDKGTRYAQYRCECGKITKKRYIKKAM